MPSEEEQIGNNADGQVAPTQPLATRSLMASADPARRLQELMREQMAAEAPAPEAAPPPPAAPPLAITSAVTPPPAVPTPPAVPAEVVRLSITLDGARLDAVEYPSLEAVPTRAELEQTHRAYLLRDQWIKSDAGPIWMVHMRRKTR